MPNLKNAQHWLDRNRPPRVQITYDVQDNGAMVKAELPFVVGVLADLQGDADPNSPPKPLRDRKFTLIDQDSFNDVFDKIGPRLELDLSQADAELGTVTINLTDKDKSVGMKGFEPARVAGKIKPINDLLEDRKKLVGLLARLSVNPELSARLGILLAVDETRKALEADVAPAAPAGSSTATAAGPGTAQETTAKPGGEHDSTAPNQAPAHPEAK